MRNVLAVTLLAATALACEPRRNEMIVHWTFEGGKTCADVGVSQIQVDIAGEVISPNVFDCRNGSQLNGGADLGSYLDGRYSVTVSGLDAYGDVSHQKTVDVVVGRSGGDFNVDLPRVIASATLHWTFAGKTCAQAGVSVVHINLDGQALTDDQNNPDIPCTNAGVDGATIEPLTAGSHTFDITGVASGAVAYQCSFSLDVAPNSDTYQAIDLPAAAPTTAIADVSWSFGGKDCQAAGVDHIYVVFDPAPNGSGTPFDDFPCLSNGLPVTGQSYDVPDGMHSFAVRGTRNSTLLYYTHQPQQTLFQIGNHTTVTVSAEPMP